MGKNGNIHPTRIFREEKDMIVAWNEFKDNLKVQAKEWLKIQYVGKAGDRVTDGQKIPMTLEGFKRFCREQKKYGEIEQYFSNQDGIYGEFIGICSRIREEIRENQIIGGMLGFFNPSITQRLNGLVDKQDINKTSIQPIKIESATPEEEKLNEETLKDLEE